MKKVLFVGLLVLSLILLAACVPTQPTGGGNHTQGPESVSSVVSIYDSEMNLVGTFSYSSATDNTIDVAQFAKTGYKIDGIFDMNRDVMLFNASGKQVPTIMLDMDFTAIVKYSPVTYQLVFDAGEGELENAAEYTQMISYEEAVGLFPKAVQQGKELDGWFDENGNRFSDGITPVSPKFTADSYPLSGEIITLHARYKIKYCDVRLIMQDGSPDVKLQVEYGQKLPDLTEYLKDDGSKAIMGFGVSPNASEPFEDAVYTDLDLYALWKEYKYVSFVYSETETKVVKVFRDGNHCTLPDGQWPGYEFEGWYSSALLTGNKITTVAFAGMQDVYYGKWSVGSYTIQFVADGALVGSYTYDIYNTDIIAPQVPEKANHSGKWEEYTLQFKDMVVNAIYTPDDLKISLTNGAEYSYQTITYGTMYTLPVPKKTGYNFTGWYYKDQKLTDENGNALAPYTFDGAVTMTAGWEAKILKLYFETNGGTVLEAVSVQYGTPYQLTQKPERAGFHFAGWYDESMEQEYVNSVTITSDTVIYAKWVKSTAISSVEDLKKIADNPAGNYHLVADIDLKGGDWAPIENFSGILDGNGYKIHNFSLRQNSIDVGFVITNSGTIKNVTFSNVEVSSVINNASSRSLGVVSAYNTGRIVNVHTDRITVLLNVANENVNGNIRAGGIVGENAGSIISCSAEMNMFFSAKLRSTVRGGVTYGTYLCLGGIVGINTGTATNVTAHFTVDANEDVYSQCHPGGICIGVCSVQNSYLYIGGISGMEYGTLTDSTADLSCGFKSTSSVYKGTDKNYRYTFIGGVAGGTHENGQVINCSAVGKIETSRIGEMESSGAMAIGGVVGKVDSGAVNNCASWLNMITLEGYGGTVGGVTGLIAVTGKVSNVVYYGTIETVSCSGGYFAGLAGRVEGWLTKGYYKGLIQTDSTNAAGIAGYVETTGAVSKTIGNGNVASICSINNGSANYNYLIGTDYDMTVLYSREMLFDTLGLFEADYWSIDEETGLYLISFPENK